MSLAYVLDPNIQIQNRAGVNNVDGWVEVLLSDTDDHAVTYSNFEGALNPERIVLDDDGRCVIIADDSKVYRVEVYGRTGNLLWTQYPVRCLSAGGSGSSSTEIISTDGSVAVDKAQIGSTTQYDLSVAKDSAEYLEYAHCLEARTPASNVFYPIGDDGSTLFSDNTGLVLTANGLFHVSLKMRATKSAAVPFYDKVNIFVKTNDGTETSEQIELSALIDGSLGLSQEFEISGDVRTGSAEQTRLFVTVEDTSVSGVSYEFVSLDIHRVFSGVPHIPGGIQGKLTAGQNITITPDNVISATGGGGGGETYESGEGIGISDGKVSVALSETEDGDGSGMRFLVHGEAYPGSGYPVAFKFHVGAAQDQNVNAGGDFVLCGLNYGGNHAYFPGVIDDNTVAVPVLVDINDMTNYIVGQPLTRELPYALIPMEGNYNRYIPVGKYSSHSSMKTQFGIYWRNYIDSNGDVYICICAYKDGVGLLGTGDGPDGHAVLRCTDNTAFFSISSDSRGWNTVPFTELSGGKLDLVSEQLQGKLNAGSGITIDSYNVISATGASVPAPSQGGERFLHCDNDGTMSWTEGPTAYRVLAASPDASEIAQIVTEANALTAKGSTLVIGILNSHDGSLMWYRPSIFRLTSATTGMVGFTCCTPDYVARTWSNGYFSAVFYADADSSQNYSRFMAGYGSSTGTWDPWADYT